MAISPKLVSTDMATTLFTRSFISPAKKVHATWPNFLKAFIQAVSDRANASKLVLNMVDETKTSFKFLLNISPGDHILNLGPGKDNTTISLARTAGRVTVLDLDLTGLYLTMLKKQFYEYDNVDLLFGGSELYWPLRDHIFDAVYVQDSLIWSMLTSAAKGSNSGLSDHHQTRWLSALFKELKRVMKPKGSVFLGVQPYLNPNQVKAKLEQITTWLGDKFRCTDIQDDFLAKSIAVVTNRHKFAAAISESGFVRTETYQISTSHGMPLKMASWSPGKGHAGMANLLSSVPRMFRKRESTRKGLYVGHTSFLSDSDHSWLKGMVKDLAQSCDIPLDTFEKKALRISRKGKLVIILKAQPTVGHELVVKVPFHKLAQDMAVNNFQTLKRLSETGIQLKNMSEFLAAFPACVHAGNYNGQVYFVEQGIPGVAWKDFGHKLSNKIVWRRTLRMLDVLKQISVGTDTLEMTVSKYGRHLEAIDSLGEQFRQRERRVWETVRGSISDFLVSCKGQLYFHKGDCSMHNIIIRSGKVPTMIDFDEAGWSPFKTLDLADLLFSYARTRKKINRAAFINMVLQGNYDQIGLCIPISECLDYLEADPTDLKISILISWIDHVYHAIQFESIKYRKYILKQSFTKTVAGLEPIRDLF